ncbi:MAG: glycosyltransferase family 39 protein, partial [Thermoanaerobaculia bacterium]|nr:glycosyltransferase family 39 protein [Thermoanaerobaculia bacterium]
MNRSGPTTRWTHYLALLAVLVLAAWVRLDGFHWDGSLEIGPGGEQQWHEHHLHPDERYLTMVATAISWPDSIADYWSTETSSLNPSSVGFESFVYGTLPLFLVRAAAETVGAIGYDQIHLVGRALAALFDLSCGLAIFLAGRRLWDTHTGLLAAAFVALSVLQIQHAHFFTVDAFLTALTTWAVVGCIANQDSPGWRPTLLAGLAAGAALATKLSVITLVPFVVLAPWLGRTDPRSAALPGRRRLVQSLVALGLLALAFRLGQPYAFLGPGFFDLSIDPTWWGSISETRALLQGQVDTPPGHQWAGRWPLAFAVWNVAAVGLGPAMALLALAGWLLIGRQLWRGDQRALIPWGFVTLLVLHLGTGWVASLRYLLPAYPWFALFAARAALCLWDKARQRLRQDGSRRRFGRSEGLAIAILSTLLLLLIPAWTWFFLSVYERDHSRVAASRWIYEHVPEGSKIAVEHWDDALPLRLDADRGRSRFQYVQMPLYATDSRLKLDWLLATLESSDYVVLSSDRLIESIPRIPMRYPMTVRYYEDLVSGELGYQLAFEIRGSPRRLGFEIALPGVEEAFSVYDHPHVRIFRRTGDFDPEQARARLTEGVRFDEVVPVLARNVDAYRDSLLTTAERQRQRQAGNPSSRRDGRTPRAAPSQWGSLIRWILAIELIGWLTWPWLVALPLRWEDRGFLLARPLGLLALSWFTWLASSLGLLSFGGGGLRFVLFLVAIPSLVLAWRRRRELKETYRRNRRLLSVGFVVFWGAFAALLLVR